ncbi:MAG: hypothetical protein IJD92_01720 [Bacilli bacterium]|nr:hypothetical protein [Bacilli bacterium]
MDKIRIAHLYYDLMNLYGEYGNIMALVKGFNDQELYTEVVNLTIDDKIDFNKYDIYYIGCGSEENQKLVIEDLLKYKDKIKKSIENGKYFIFTGNSYEILGKYIEKVNGEKIETLNIFDFYSKEVDKRIIGEQVMESNCFKEPIIAFQNRQCVLNNKDNHLFEVINGFADNNKSKYEGIHYKNLFATYNLGPLLIRNPLLKDYIIKSILDEKEILYKKVSTIDEKAYNEFVKNFIS